MAVKFSQFFSGGNLNSTDIPVGLQNGNNAQFNYAQGTILQWNDVNVNTVMMGSNGYYTTGGGILLLTLPVVMAKGSILRVVGFESAGWQIVQNAGQQIYFQGQETTSGTLGFLASDIATDTVELLCVTANVNFVVISNEGNIAFN